jgi:hypothetical protein
LEIPKALGGWGLKNIFLFSKALVAKSTWRLISTSSLWTSVVTQKYIHTFYFQLDQVTFEAMYNLLHNMEGINKVL